MLVEEGDPTYLVGSGKDATLDFQCSACGVFSELGYATDGGIPPRVVARSFPKLSETKEPPLRKGPQDPFYAERKELQRAFDRLGLGEPAAALATYEPGETVAFLKSAATAHLWHAEVVEDPEAQALNRVLGRSAELLESWYRGSEYPSDPKRKWFIQDLRTRALPLEVKAEVPKPGAPAEPIEVSFELSPVPPSDEISPGIWDFNRVTPDEEARFPRVYSPRIPPGFSPRSGSRVK